jgi:hypothetical protein
LAAQTRVLAAVAPPALAAQSLGVASGLDAPLSTCAHVLDHGAQAAAQAAACGNATLPSQEKINRQLNRRAEFYDTFSSREAVASFHISTREKMMRLRDDAPLKNARASRQEKNTQQASGRT